MTYSVRMKGVEKALRSIKKPAELHRWAKPAMEETTALVQDEIAKYPRKSPGAFSQLATPAQRRAYWARVNAGEIRHGANGYIRGGNLGRKWTTRVKVSTRAVEGVVGNNTPYARYVQSQAQQQPFHGRSEWPTDEKTATRLQSRIDAIWQRYLNRVLNSS